MTARKTSATSVKSPAELASEILSRPTPRGGERRGRRCEPESYALALPVSLPTRRTLPEPGSVGERRRPGVFAVWGATKRPLFLAVLGAGSGTGVSETACAACAFLT